MLNTVTLGKASSFYNAGMNLPRVLLSLIAGAGAALVAYAIAYTHGNPHPAQGDPLLAFRLIPLELLAGLLGGALAFRAYGRRAASPPRLDAAERMVLQLAYRRGGRFSVQDLTLASPLSEAQAREAVGRMVAAGALREDAGEYRLP